MVKHFISRQLYCFVAVQYFVILSNQCITGSVYTAIAGCRGCRPVTISSYLPYPFAPSLSVQWDSTRPPYGDHVASNTSDIYNGPTHRAPSMSFRAKVSSELFCEENGRQYCTNCKPYESWGDRRWLQ